MANLPKSPLEESQLADAIQELNAYGYYVLVAGLFYQIEPYSLKMEFGFNKLGNLKYAPVDENIRIVVFRPKWHYEHTSFFAQDLDIVNHDYTKRIEPRITQRSENIFELYFPALKPGQLLIIRDYNNLYGIGMGSISDTLINLFNTTEAPASAVLQNIKQALKSFPQNVQLQASKCVWELKEVNEKTAKTWRAVVEKLAKYNERDDRQGKLVFANDVVNEIQYYLSLDENPLHKKEAQKILAEIERFKSEKQEVKVTDVPDRSLLSKQIAFYKAGQFTLTAVEIGEDVLLRFKGLPNEFNEKVLRHKKAVQNEATGAYILQTNEINGDNWNTFNYENDGWGGLRTFVYPPLIEQQFDVHMTESGGNSDSPEKMYLDYCDQIGG